MYKYSGLSYINEATRQDIEILSVQIAVKIPNWKVTFIVGNAWRGNVAKLWFPDSEEQNLAKYLRQIVNAVNATFEIVNCRGVSIVWACARARARMKHG